MLSERDSRSLQPGVTIRLTFEPPKKLKPAEGCNFQITLFPAVCAVFPCVFCSFLVFCLFSSSPYLGSFSKFFTFLRSVWTPANGCRVKLAALSDVRGRRLKEAVNDAQGVQSCGFTRPRALPNRQSICRAGHMPLHMQSLSYFSKHVQSSM